DYEKYISPGYLEKINAGYSRYLKGYPEEQQLVLDINELDFVSNPKDYAFVVQKIQHFALEQLMPRPF
ncbi:MAG: 2-amino-4-hydroxy-6-hydroxymethyldihydropteridine diphosphokinase, partial [Bacteroidota bacterium]